MKLQFWGAAREVTGSKHILKVNGSNYLLDCGLCQGGKGPELDQKNRDFLIQPKDIRGIFLSHAHIDHSGLIPYFVANGFEGEVHTTAATRDLCSYMLSDSAHIQELDYEYGVKKGDTAEMAKPLYTTKDIPATMDRFVSYNYRHSHRIDENIDLDLWDAGHVLGSALVELDVKEGSSKKTIVFTGDLGRKGLPILRDPTVREEADVVIIESTYGNRTHDPIKSMKSDMLRAVNDIVERRGKLIIPAFSLERTQEVIYLLHALYDEKAIPDIPIYVDSPLSMNLTQVFRMHPEAYDEATYQQFLQHQDSPFNFGSLKFVSSTEESKALNDVAAPCIIISSSGMCEAGRIRHHIANNIENERNIVLFIGYQAEGTLGRRLVENKKNPNFEVKIFGQVHRARAEIRVLNSFSAHADKDDIMDWLGNFKSKPQVFLVHGEAPQMEPLKAAIEAKYGLTVHMPQRGEEFEI